MAKLLLNVIYVAWNCDWVFKKVLTLLNVTSDQSTRRGLRTYEALLGVL